MMKQADPKHHSPAHLQPNSPCTSFSGHALEKGDIRQSLRSINQRQKRTHCLASTCYVLRRQRSHRQVRNDPSYKTNPHATAQPPAILMPVATRTKHAFTFGPSKPGATRLSDDIKAREKGTVIEQCVLYSYKEHLSLQWLKSGSGLPAFRCVETLL